MIYTDGGPDHNISFLNVKIAWLAYFLSRFDTLIEDEENSPYSKPDEPG